MPGINILASSITASFCDQGHHKPVPVIPVSSSQFLKPASMSASLSQDQLAQFQYCFKLFDSDKDGVINKADIKSSLTALGYNPTDVELKEMVSILDTNKNGEIDFEEFLGMVSKKMKIGASDEEIKDTLRVFDKDCNGFISAAELRQALTNLGQKLTEEEVDEMIKEVDFDGDGQIDYAEFLSMMKKQ